MRASYLDYVTSKLGLRRGSQYEKSARIVGEVLGKYHPLGDSPITRGDLRPLPNHRLQPF